MTLYERLKVTRTATLDEIKKAFRILAIRCHPDKNPGDVQKATLEFREIHEAYQILSDPEQRKRYDSYIDLKAGIVPETPREAKSSSSKGPVAQIQANWKEFIWNDSTFEQKEWAMRAFAEYVNESEDLNIPMPPWIEFYMVTIEPCELQDLETAHVNLTFWEWWGPDKKIKIPVQFHRLLSCRDPENRNILYKIKDIAIIALLPIEKRFESLCPPNASLMHSPFELLLECKSWDKAAFLKILKLLPVRHQVLACKKYFEYLDSTNLAALMKKINKAKTKYSLIRLCNAVYHLLQYVEILKNKKGDSSNELLTDKIGILEGIMSLIDSGNASHEEVLKALDELQGAETLKKPRNPWDPRTTKSFLFFNELQVALTHLKAPPKPPSFISKSERLKRLYELSWNSQGMDDKIHAMQVFRDYVNSNEVSNKTLLMPEFLTDCVYSDYFSELYWNKKSFQHTSSGLIFELYVSEIRQGQLLTDGKYRGYRQIESKKTPVSFMFNQLLQYRSKNGRDCFGGYRFDLVLIHIQRSLRLPLLMKEAGHLLKKTKLMTIFEAGTWNGVNTAAEVLHLLPHREQIIALSHIIQAIQKRIYSNKKYFKAYDNKRDQEYLEALWRALESKGTDPRLLRLFKASQILIAYQAKLEHDLGPQSNDTLLSQKCVILKTLVNDLQDPQLTIKNIKNSLSDIFNNKTGLLKTRRHWFNPNTPKSWLYLKELEGALADLPEESQSLEPWTTQEDYQILLPNR